jgi:amidase
VARMGGADDGLPVGVQIVAPQYGDLSSIRFAQLVERAYGGFVPPPGFA